MFLIYKGSLATGHQFCQLQSRFRWKFVESNLRRFPDEQIHCYYLIKEIWAQW